MKRSEYLEHAFEAYNSGRVDADTYDCMIQNIDIFCDDDDEDDECCGLPSTYAEVEYDDFDDAEAIDGARWDDMNYMHYMER